MKKIILSTTILIFCSFFSWGQISVIIEGIDNATHVETNVENLLDAINECYNSKQAFNASNLDITPDCKSEISDILSFSPIQITEKLIRCNAAEVANTKEYQIRNIPILLEEYDENQKDTANRTKMNPHEIVISFDSRGKITDFQIAIDQHSYSKILSSRDVADKMHRQMVLHFLEQFRTAYNTKDITFLKQIYSDDAIIITGKVINVKPSEIHPSGEKVTYKQQDKDEYISNLQRVFSNNKKINVSFDEIEVKMHPTNPNWYGVMLKQGWTSDLYHDEGYVFLLWDFSNENEPTIHIRTWQPEKYITTDDEKFSLDDFDIAQ